MEELSQPLDTGFIKKVHFQSLVANVIVVEKANGK